jgi:hypothetical protein
VRARARAVELIAAQPPTPLRARVTAAMAQALVNARRREEAHRWCEAALVAAREAGRADDEADALVTLAMLQEYDDPANARSLYAAGRARAATAGNLEIESRALLDLAWMEFGRGNLAAARAVFDEGAELAQRTGLGWSRFGIDMRRGQCLVRYEAGDWDECERLVAAVPDLVTSLPVARLVSATLPVQVGRGRAAAAKRLRELRPAWMSSPTSTSSARRPTTPSGKVTSNEPDRPSSVASQPSKPAPVPRNQGITRGSVRSGLQSRPRRLSGLGRLVTLGR